VRCGYDKDIRALQIDHINSDGAEHRKSIKSSYGKYYKAVAMEPERYQILCANCNTIKMTESHERSWQYTEIHDAVDVEIPERKTGPRLGVKRGPYKWTGVGPDGKRIQPGRGVNPQRLAVTPLPE
jgi:hypothetical protein